MSLFPQYDNIESVYEAMHRFQNERDKLALYILKLNVLLEDIIEIGCEQCDLDMSSAGPEIIGEAQSLIADTHEYIENLK